MPCIPRVRFKLKRIKMFHESVSKLAPRRPSGSPYPGRDPTGQNGPVRVGSVRVSTSVESG